MLIAANFCGLWLLLRTQIELDVGVCKTAAAPWLLGEAPTHCLVHCLIYLLFLFLSILFLNHTAVLSVVFSLPFQRPELDGEHISLLFLLGVLSRRLAGFVCSKGVLIC